MRGRVYLACFTAMACGIAVTRSAGAPWVAALLFLTACAPAICMRKRYRSLARVALVVAAAAFLGTLLTALSMASVSCGIVAELARKTVAAEVGGRICSTPRQAGDLTSFFVEVTELRSGGRAWSTRERVLVNAQGKLAPDFYNGVKIISGGRLYCPRDMGAWLRNSGAAAVFSAPAGKVKKAQAPPDPVSRAVARSRNWLSGAFRKLFDGRTAGFLEGVSLSKTDRMDAEVVADLQATGLSHIVAISGMNVSSAAALALLLLGAAGAGRKSRYAGAVVMAMLVLAISDFSVSAARAAVMGTVCFAGSMTGRRYEPLAGLSIAGMVLLCLNPMCLYQASFQYSFAAALGIVAAMRSTEKKERSKVRLALAVCSAAQLAVLPLMVARGDLVPVVAVFANLLVVWSLGLLLFTSWVAAVVSAVSLPLARALGAAPALMARYVMEVASICARLPGAGVSMGAASVAALAAYVSALCMFASRKRRVIAPCVALGLAVSLVLFASYGPAGGGGSHTMTVLDVGQGDSILLRGSSGSVTLVDGGPDGETVMRKLRERGIGRIDLMVATHPHADHCAGLIEVMRRLPVGRLLEPGVPDAQPGTYVELMRLAARLRVPVTVARDGQEIRTGDGLAFEVLYAPASLPEAPENENDLSIVLMAEAQGAKALLCGDIESDGQRRMLEAHPSLPCEVVKVPHQGAADSATDGLYDATRPTLAVISVGRGNSYGHPSRVCLSLLASRGISVVRTDHEGDVTVCFTGGRIALLKKRR